MASQPGSPTGEAYCSSVADTCNRSHDFFRQKILCRMVIYEKGASFGYVIESKRI